ncbi:MAG: hypothetical protein PHS44_06140 [Candidatus Dojkabacteria bacterium]|jgi:hypothetical protein|nr:hypothetical protein [Candidatus Dojkabacteria bacterium]
MEQECGVRILSVVVPEGYSTIPYMPVQETGDWTKTISVTGWGGDRLILGQNGTKAAPFVSGEYMHVQDVPEGVVVRASFGPNYYLIPPQYIQN